MLFAVVGKSRKVICSFHFLFLEWTKTCFPCEWLVFWVTNGEVSVWKGKTLNHSLRSWLKTFPFSTLTSPFVTQKTSHSQGKQFSSLQKEKMKRTKYHFFIFYERFCEQCRDSALFKQIVRKEKYQCIIFWTKDRKYTSRFLRSKGQIHGGLLIWEILAFPKKWTCCLTSKVTRK